MTKLLPLTLFVIILILQSCSDSQKLRPDFAGGHARVAIKNEPRHYSPHFVDDFYTAKLLEQCFEGLIGFNSKTLQVEGRIAESWKINKEDKTISFTIRKDVFFHDNPLFDSKEDRRLTSADIEYSILKSCRPNEKNEIPSAYSLLFKDNLVGAKAYFNGESNKIEGFSIDGNTVTFSILESEFNFLNKLANISCAIVSKKIDSQSNEQKQPIGTGPFVYADYKTDPSPRIILIRNNDYYQTDPDGYHLPYLDSVSIIIEPKTLNQLNMFENEELDLIVGIPTSRLTSMMEEGMENFKTGTGKYVLSNNYLLESSYYLFDLTDKRFQDPKVRKAFNLALNKKVIGRDILFNQFNDLGYYGIVPPIGHAFQGYDFSRIKTHGYSYNPEKARRLLKEAGYPNGEGFGTVTLRYNIDDVHSAIADEFSKQIFNTLGITVNIDGSNFEKLSEDATTAKGDIFRMGWSADYPSPETFLANFYGGTVPEDIHQRSNTNQSRYVNPVYDSILESARISSNHQERMKLFSEAECVLLDNPPLIPLWYAGDLLVSRTCLTNFHFNALNIYDFKNTYIRRK